MQIEQIDMDAAAALLDRLGGIQRFEKLGVSFAGIDNATCGAFARHRLTARSALPADNVVKALQQALVNHNDVLRSAYQIAARQGNSTDWDGFTKRAGSVLHFHHDEVNAARAAIAAMGSADMGKG